MTIRASSGTVGEGLLVHESAVLVQGDLGEALMAGPHEGIGSTVQLDAEDGSRTETIAVVAVHIVRLGGPYVVLALASPATLPASAMPPGLTEQRFAAMGVDPPDDQRPLWVCLMMPWLCPKR